MALARRDARAVIHHSDQGSQYTSVAFGKRCTEMGVRPSMGTVGDAYDNAMAESFFASLECELLDRRVVQPAASAWLDRLSCSGRVRAPPCQDRKWPSAPPGGGSDGPCGSVENAMRSNRKRLGFPQA